MTLQALCDKLQVLCHNGHSQDEILINTNKMKSHFCTVDFAIEPFEINDNKTVYCLTCGDIHPYFKE